MLLFWLLIKRHRYSHSMRCMEAEIQINPLLSNITPWFEYNTFPSRIIVELLQVFKLKSAHHFPPEAKIFASFWKKTVFLQHRTVVGDSYRNSPSPSKTSVKNLFVKMCVLKKKHLLLYRLSNKNRKYILEKMWESLV